MRITVYDTVVYRLAKHGAGTPSTDVELRINHASLNGIHGSMTLQLEDLRPLAAALIAKAEELERVRVSM